VSDDLDVYKEVADGLGLDHQICRSHVKRNVDALAESLREQLQTHELLPEGVVSSPEGLVQDWSASGTGCGNVLQTHCRNWRPWPSLPAAPAPKAGSAIRLVSHAHVGRATLERWHRLTSTSAATIWMGPTTALSD